MKITSKSLVPLIALTSIAIARAAGDDTGWTLAAGPSYSRFATDARVLGTSLGRSSFDLYGGEFTAGYHLDKLNEIGFAAGCFAGDHKNLDLSLIDANLRGYYHFNYAINDTVSVFAGPAFGLSVLYASGNSANPLLGKLSGTAISPNIGADIGLNFNITGGFGIQLGYSYTYTLGTRLDFSSSTLPGVVSADLRNITSHQVGIKAVWRF